MNFKKILCAMLALLMCLPILASCNDGPQVITSTGANAGLDPEYPAADYQGEDFTFLVIKHTDQIKDYYGGNFIDAESITGDSISDAVYNRNLKVEEKYNVKVTQREEVNTTPAEKLSELVMAGDFTYDVIYGWGYKMGACIVENYFGDFNSLADIDLTKEYWSPSAVEDLTVNDSLYLCINDISMNKLEWASLLLYNKALYEDYNVGTTFGDIYQLVRDGKWTLDTYLEMLKSVSRDLNGDSAITRDDVFGMVDGDATGSGLLAASGVSWTTKNDDGSYTANIYSEKTLSIIEKVYAVYSNNDYVKPYSELLAGADITGYDDEWQFARSIFATDHALFCGGSANTTSETAFRNMESEYGIVPMPKYDETQENYVSMVTSLASIFAIPATSRQDMSTAGPERTGKILEYMAFKSNQLLLPVYYEQVLKGQRLAEDDSEMLDIVRSTVRYEISEMTSENPAIAETVTAMFKKPTTATSVYKSKQNKIQSELDDFYTDVLLLGTQVSE